MVKKKQGNKKQHKKKANYLLITTALTVVVLLIVSHFAYGNGFDVLNTLSTTATEFAFLLIPVVTLFVFVFWLKLLVDAAQKERWLWLIAMLIGSGFFALLYLLFEKPKITPASFKPTAWVALTLFVALFAQQMYVMWGNNVDLSKLQPTGREFQAKVITKNLHGYTYSGKTTCREEQLPDGSYYIDVMGGVINLSAHEKQSLHYMLSYSGESTSELTSGWEGGQTSEPVKIKTKNVEELVGGPMEIDGPLNSCTLEFWSENN